MADPKRLLSQLSDADQLERALLGSLQHLEPPGSAKAEAWARVSAQIAAVGLASATHASATAAGSSAAAAASGAGSTLGFAPPTLKLLGSKLIVGLALAGGVFGASALWSQFRSRPVPAIASAPAPTARAPVQEPVPLLLESAPPETPPRLAAPATERLSKASSEQSATDRLSAESALLTQARAQLRSGDAATAQQTLTRLRANFPKGVLGQEREVLAIEVLAAQGNTEAARRRARAFMVAYPKSPHSPQLSRLAGDP